MRIITAIPPEELEIILKKSNAAVRLEIREAEPFHGMPRYEVIIKGDKEEIEKFMKALRLARAGG
ncbi:TIGR04140 family protein [Thermococcus sp. M39]|uniref:TIGR04140 family protein n=1 Tax=unclassified Thermococcus TaxID=2627626 RepID=UPI001439139F|nr:MULTISPECIES: TIGR04140 family protein [unclassified Thermococcus]NJE07676.1 TIGR04140 family protein [Thermococcus sp. M39]NJE12232.1 TIGR04140 family protein [Thermococcus sp. LS2]